MRVSLRSSLRLLAFLELALLEGGFLATILLSCAPPGAAATLEVRFPALPAAWTAALGEASWSLRWTDSDGAYRRQDDAPQGMEVELSADTASAILAYPYWPAFGLEPGMARPAGAIHPFDEDDESLLLDWKGGPPAVFFRELTGTGGAERTIPERFDWPRFRSLLYGDLVAAEVAADPWLVDWRSVAEKTRASGFDRRRLVPRPTETMEFTVPAPGPWAAASPFASPPSWTAGEAATVAAAAEAESFFCAAGVLRYSQEAVVWLPTP